jgi:lysophospholipase L1-like esterase
LRSQDARKSIVSRRLSLFAVLLCLVALSLGCSGSERSTYLALGDSFAVGDGASKKSEAYVPLFLSFLEQDKNESLSLRNLAVDGETTTSMIAEGQLGVALAELRFRNHDSDPKNDVFVITIDIGGNDVRDLAGEGRPCAPPTSITDPACTRAVTSALQTLSENLRAILRTVRVAAGPDVRIFVLDYFNPYSGTGKPLEEAGDIVLPVLNKEINDIATSPEINAEVVQTFAAFKGKGGDLTNVNATESDFHPNDAGYRLLADLLIAAYQH